ncbi:MAG: SDR family NAD(P)-dependent oxidoreductase [Sphingomonadaceae bacterium]
MGTLAGRVAIVTGAASGIGLAIARAFLGEGARVVAADLPGSPLAAELPASEALAHLFADVTDRDAPGRLVAAAAPWGGAHILVNNAGICLPGTIEDQSDESWERVFAVNVTAMFRITRACVPAMKAHGWGRIINIGSIMSDFGGSGLCAYGASKHAVAGLTRSMAVDLGPHGITANYIQPSAIWTGLSRPFFDDPDFRAYWEGKAPVGFIGEPEDVAPAALFLASEAARFVNGAGIRVCGGAMARF